MHRRHLLPLVTICLATICLATAGCTSLTPPIGEMFSVSSDQAARELNSPDMAPPPDVPSFVVEMRGANNESQKFKRPLTDDATYVQGVLAQSNALKHFGRVKIELWRARPDGQGFYKVDIPYDRKQKMVPPTYDYAIHEGDRLVFRQDDSTILDDMLGSLGGM